MVAIDGAVVAAGCGLTAGVAWGGADFLGARAARQHHPVAAAAVGQFWGAAAYALVYAIALPHHGQLTFGASALAVGAGVFLALGLMTFFMALEVGPMSVVAPIGSAYPLVTTIVAVAVFAATPTGPQLVGVALIVAGVVACSGVVEARRADAHLTRGVRMAIATLVLWGVALALLGEAVAKLGWERAALVQATGSVAVFAAALVVLRRRTPRLALRLTASDAVVAASGLVLAAGNVVFDLGLSHVGAGGVPVVAAISACYPALTVVLAVRHFGERIRPVPLCGAVLAMGGVALSAM